MEAGEKLRILSKRIKDYRLEKGLTQQSLAALCDVDIRTIQRIETGNYTFNVNLLFKLGNALDVDLATLIQGL